MNERIQQLASEAGLLFQRDKLNYEELKFAELIVKECNNLNKQVITQCNLEHYLVFDRIVNKYQEHFGVEQ